MANRNRYDDRGRGDRGGYRGGNRLNSDDERDRYSRKRAGNYRSGGEDREDDSYEGNYGDYGGNYAVRRGGRERGQGRDNYGDLGGSYSNTSDQGEYGGGYYSGRADYDEEYEDDRASDRGYSRDDYSRRRTTYGVRSSGRSDQNRIGDYDYYGQGSNDYGGGGTYGGYRDRDYTERRRSGEDRARRSGSNRERGGNEYETGDRGSWLERAGDEVASWFGYGEEDDRGERRHRGRGPRNYKRSDERIREDINDRLTDDFYLDASDIEVEVAEGEVLLKGTVHSRRDKRRAEDIAEYVSGVKHVENRLRVSQPNSSTSGHNRSVYDRHETSGNEVTNLVLDSATGHTGTTSTSGMTTGEAEATGTETGSSGTTGSQGTTATGTSRETTSGTALKATGNRSRNRSA